MEPNDSKRLWSRERWGLLCYFIAAFCFQMMVLTVKLIGRSGMSSFHALLARSVLLAMVSIVRLKHAGQSMLGARKWLLTLRGVLGCTSVTALFFAAQHLPLADTMVFTFLAPIIVAILSPFLLHESSRGAWVGIIGCSLGILLVAQPGFIFGATRLELAGVILGLFHATTSGLAKMCLRALKDEATHTKMLYLAVFSTVLSAGALMAPSRLSSVGWLSTYQAFLLLTCGVWGYGAQVFMTIGLENVRAAKALTMTYSSVVWSELAGVFLFDERPNSWAVGGLLMIICSTCYSSFITPPSARELGKGESQETSVLLLSSKSTERAGAAGNGDSTQDLLLDQLVRAKQ